jgi:hypothetical protein
MTLLDTMWDLEQHRAKAQERVEREILFILGKNPDDSATWGFEDFTFDGYDRSFELKGCRESFVLTDDQRTAFAALGFHQCWMCKKINEYDPGIHHTFVENPR